MRILYSNLWDDYSLIESQENSSYPVENTQDIRLVKTWRTQTPSAATIYLDAGTGVTISCDCAAIIEHNFSGSASIVVQAATASTFANIALSANVAYRAGIMVVYFSSGTFRFWRFNFSDTGNSDGYYQVGRLFLGAYLQVDPSSLLEFPEEHIRTDRVIFSRSNQLYGDEGVGYKQVHYKFEWASSSAKTLIETMWNNVGRKKPLLIMNYDTTFSVIEPLYCAIVEDITFEHKRFDRWHFELSLRECD